eukprot:5183629-Pyramimonas_sp.AAC.1
MHPRHRTRTPARCDCAHIHFSDRCGSDRTGARKMNATPSSPPRLRQLSLSCCPAAGTTR